MGFTLSQDEDEPTTFAAIVVPPSQPRRRSPAVASPTTLLSQSLQPLQPTVVAWPSQARRTTVSVLTTITAHVVVYRRSPDMLLAEICTSFHLHSPFYCQPRPRHHCIPDMPLVEICNFPLPPLPDL
ncbi:hypothetical protein TIFTF001_025341 [Ficus carica]|uniref:Uncharacterized protein n=1 Tax=Ficus carica TaxID=3494 RepID=A0AA88DFH1_FICCA|nr:hypothetical protein TIFTF001_025341 [Ficus carica]